MDRWASGRGWAEPNANGPSLLDWAITAGPCRKLGCSRYRTEGAKRTRKKKSSCGPSLWRRAAGEKWPFELRVSVRVRAPGFRGR
ncbi:hypothetical protein CRG98_031250, partial [Punica granatum]